MSKQRCVQITVSVTFFVIRLFGFFPYYINKKSEKCQTTWFLLLYPIVIYIGISSGWIWIFRTIFNDLRVSVFTDTSNIVIGLFSTTNIMLFTLNYCSQYFHFSALFKVANEAKQAIHVTNLSPQLVNWKSLNKYWFKCVIIPILYMTVNDNRILRLSKNANGKYLPFIFIDLSLFCGELIANLHYALLLCTSLTFALINGKLGEIMKEAQTLSREYSERKDIKNRMQQFCNLSDRLDCVAEMHSRCSSVSEQLQCIFNRSVTFWIFNKQSALVTQLFLVYVMTIDWVHFQIYRENIENPMDLVCLGCALVVLNSLEMFALAKECTQATSEVSYIELLFYQFLNIYFKMLF